MTFLSPDPGPRRSRTTWRAGDKSGWVSVGATNLECRPDFFIIDRDWAAWKDAAVLSLSRGAVTTKNSPDLSPKNFRLLPGKGWFGGVCAGLAYWLGLPLWLVRLVWGVAFFVYGVGLVPYLVLWMVVPNAAAPADYGERTGDS